MHFGLCKELYASLKIVQFKIMLNRECIIAIIQDRVKGGLIMGTFI